MTEAPKTRSDWTSTGKGVSAAALSFVLNGVLSYASLSGQGGETGVVVVLVLDLCALIISAKNRQGAVAAGIAVGLLGAVAAVMGIIVYQFRHWTVG